MKDERPVLGKLFFTSFTELCKGFLNWPGQRHPMSYSICRFEDIA